MEKFGKLANFKLVPNMGRQQKQKKISPPPKKTLHIIIGKVFGGLIINYKFLIGH